MRFRNAVHITIDNFSCVFKMLLYTLVTEAIFMSLSYLILRLGLDGIFSGSPTRTLLSLIAGFLDAVRQGTTGAWFNDLFAAWESFLDLLRHSTSAITGTLIGLALIYLVSRFVNGLGRVAVAGNINDRMGTFARTTFAGSYFKNIAKGALYEIVYVPLAFLYDVIMAAFCWLCFFFLPALLNVKGWFAVLVALALTVTAVAGLEALKMTLISSWLPSMLNGNRMGKSMRGSFLAGKHFAHRYASFLVAVYLIIAVNVLFALCTLGSGLFITLPLSFVFLFSLQFVQYYEDNGKRYFISSRKVEGGQTNPDNIES